MKSRKEMLEDAIEIIKFTNDLSFADFVSGMEDDQGWRFTLSLIQEWKATGLNNVDFFKQGFEKGQKSIYKKVGSK